MTNRIKFISYDGGYPNLCSGTLTMSVDGIETIFPDLCLCSGGNVWFDDNCQEHVETGKWVIVRFPPNFPEDLKKETTKIVNENIPHGCCGGCV